MITINVTNVNATKLHQELINANLTPLFVETSGTTTVLSFTEVDTAAVQAVITAHNPAADITTTFEYFKGVFLANTIEQLIGLYDAASSSRKLLIKDACNTAFEKATLLKLYKEETLQEAITESERAMFDKVSALQFYIVGGI